MKKLLILSLLSITAVNVKGMSQKDINKIDEDGKNKLHQLALMNDDREQGKILNATDMLKASNAAWLIMEGLSVTAPDKTGNTPLSYIEKIKDRYPQTHKIMQAGEIKRKFDSEQIKPNKGEYLHAMKTIWKHYPNHRG